MPGDGGGGGGQFKKQRVQLLSIYLVCSFSANLHLSPSLTASISGLGAKEEVEYPFSPCHTCLSTLPSGLTM